MKALKKEKMDESKARKQAEELNKKVRKEKQTAEQEVKEQKAMLKQAEELVSHYRELQKFANEQYNQLAEHIENKDQLQNIPSIDEKMLELLESKESTDKE